MAAASLLVEPGVEVVYLLHFDQPLRGAIRKDAPKKVQVVEHYCGTSKDLERRLYLHEQGQGARLLQVAREHGITWTLVQVWAGGRRLERKLKDSHNLKRYCPICKGEF